jgi:hypothetical protein
MEHVAGVWGTQFLGLDLQAGTSPLRTPASNADCDVAGVSILLIQQLSRLRSV